MNGGLKLLRKVKGVWVAVAIMSGFMGAGQIELPPKRLDFCLTFGGHCIRKMLLSFSA